MSILTTFSNAAFQKARTVIGGEDLAIGSGDAVQAVLNEHTTGKDYELGGFDENHELTAVVDSSEFLAAYPGEASTYLGKKALTRSRTFRVSRISAGQCSTTIHLVSSAG